MFRDSAMPLIKMLGASDALPGAIGGEDILAAVVRLKKRLDDSAAKPTQPVNAGVNSGASGQSEYEPPIALAMRAVPLIQLLERAAAAKAPVMWELA
jgi:hypothetical protein